MCKTKKLWLASAALIWLLVPVNAFALIGEDIAYLLQIYRATTQVYQTEQQTQRVITDMARTVIQPGGWKNALTIGTGTASGFLNKQTTGHDQNSFDMLTASVNAAKGALHDTSSMGSVLSTSDAANLALVNLQAATMKLEADRQQANLQHYSDLNWYAQREGQTRISTDWVPRR